MTPAKPLLRPSGPFRTHAAGAILLLAGYIALDWASYIFPLGPFNITPWNPPPALAVVWMMLGGLPYAAVVFVAASVADIVIRGAPGGMWVTGFTSCVLAAGYAAVVVVLRRFFGPGAQLSNTRQLWILVLVTVVGTGLVALLYVGVLRTAGFVAADSFADAVLRYWLGDLVGVLVTAPLLLVAASPDARRQLLRSWRRPDTALQFAVLMAGVYLIFAAANDPSRFFYVLFLPLIWIAVRGGLPNATLASAVVQLGVVLGTRGSAMQSLAAVELQALVAAFTLTGLFLGVMVDERAHAAEELKKTLRLAAAGEMAGAIAHELKQPLAAIVNYAGACLIMLDREPSAEARATLAGTIEKMLGESRRAGKVLGRLRDFFRSGTMRLEETPVESLLASALQIGRGLDRSSEVEFGVEGHAGEETLIVDRLQIELVLRNLLANAFESVVQQPAGERRVGVIAETGATEVLFRVVDSGPGISPSMRERLFQPFASGKSQGMGLGLAISQAIAQAHGGSLAAATADHGEFHLRLPRRREDA